MFPLFKFQFLIGIINLGTGGTGIVTGSRFQFLIGIINQRGSEILHKRGKKFQFLIGIINPMIPKVHGIQKIVSIPHRYYKSVVFIVVQQWIAFVSIPHRYYKSVPALQIHHLCKQFQFLIGIINPGRKRHRQR